VAGDQRQLRIAQLAVEDVEVGASDAAGANRDQHLTRLRRRIGHLRQLKRGLRPLQNHRAHRHSPQYLPLKKRAKAKPCSVDSQGALMVPPTTIRRRLST
jgi:hypothetical protein